MIHPLLDRLDDEDDAALWQVALDHILAELEKKPGMLVQVGRCSHWPRPHQSHWLADGSFALPVGYGGGQGSQIPQFDWSVFLEWRGDTWIEAQSKGSRTAIRITIPSRTTRHQQAAIHTIWMTGKDKEWRLYGFRMQNGAWKCTAETEWAEDRQKRTDR